jgi:pimeloyl-ACP methyl ester carboxylesterase
MNQFPHDLASPLTGFGGDTSMNQAQHRDSIRKCPVLLVHGNAGNSVHPDWGMQAMKAFLKKAGYQDCEIWAMDYLGEDNEQLIMGSVHADHIDGFRAFVDKVRDYLDVQRLDFIAHSLGCGMVNAYLKGLQSNGEWDYEDQRCNLAGTFVALAGATYGLGPQAGQDARDFATGGIFERASHHFRDIDIEDTPFGPVLSAQSAPVDAWRAASALDDSEIGYVAVIARHDLCDMQHADTSRRVGANANKVFELGFGQVGHRRVIHEQTVFDFFLPFMNQYPPAPPVRLSVDKDSGNYGPSLEIAVTVSPADATIAYTARRLTKAVQASALTESVAQTSEGSLSNNQVLTLATDGAWDVTFRAGSGTALERTYGVHVVLPELTIFTDNSTPFQGSLEVKAAASKGTVYYSTDRVHWLADSSPIIHETSTLYFIAIDADGLASAIASRAFEKKPVQFARATLTEHFIAHRIDIEAYISLTQQLGPNAVITLYFVNSSWVRDPDTTEIALTPPSISVPDDASARTEALDLTVAAHHPTDAAPAIYYTLDGSTPTRHSPSFTSSGSIRLDTAGTRTLKCRACDAAGNWSDTVTRVYRMDISDTQSTIRCDKPSGVYPGAVDATISAADPRTRVYYTEDGSDPSDARNPNRKSFEGSQRFTIRGNDAHALLCYAKDGAGRETVRAFGWQIDDHDYPETRISPSNGGSFVGSVRVELSASEPCEWVRYTLDGSEPSETNGETYAGPITLDQSAQLRFRSMSTAGKLEPVKSATFIVTPQPDRQVFESDARQTGCLVARHDDGKVLVGTDSILKIGAVPGTMNAGDGRAILQFETSSLPDNAAISRAWLELPAHAQSGDVWSDGRTIQIDVRRGYFGTSHALHAGGWNAEASAEGVAQLGNPPSSGTCRSTEFSADGLAAINRTGVTQIRLRMTPPADAQSGACLMLEGGQKARLYVTLASLD